MTAPERLADGAERLRIRHDLDSTLFVEAAAGTGKTTELVARVVTLLSSGRTTLERIVAVTFTEKAAGEMKLRLREEIELARGEPEARARLDQALGQLELARIGTIHGFCAELLRERPIESGVDPLFEVAAEDEAAQLLDRAFGDWFERMLSDPPDGVRRMLRRRPRDRDGQTPRQALRAAAAALVEHRDFTAAWRRDPFDRCGAIDRMLESLAEVGGLAGLASWADDYLAQNLAEIHRFVRENELHEAVRGRDYDALEAELRELLRSRQVHWNWRGSPRRPYGTNLPRETVLARRDAVRADLEQFCTRADADLAPLLREELRPVVDAYERLKQTLGKLDFLDLLLRTRDVLVRDRAVRVELQGRFTHYFVDEFQDTDPLQAEIVLLLAADDPEISDWNEVRPVPGKLFLVGDPKQSIYRFRRADVAVYEAVKRRLDPGRRGLIRLRTSFRAPPSLQDAVNAAFAPLIQERPNGSQAAYVPLEPFRPEAVERPSLVALPVPRPYVDWGNRAFVAKSRIEESLPDAVGAFVEWLVRESGWMVTERERPNEPVPVQARHVCILLRRLKRFRDDITRGYVRALEVRQIQHVLVGGRSFHDREEVLAIRNALGAIEWPEDELRVFATLRGPLFALDDEALLGFRQRFGTIHPLRRYELDGVEGPQREVGEALGLLRGLHLRRNRRPVAETIGRLLQSVRAHAGIAIWPTGEQALANCLRMVDLARRFERRGAVSFRSFVERMEAEAENGASDDAPVVEEGTEGVRIMSVHRAKGLEFPVVILVDPTCSAVREPPMRHVDASRGLWVEPLCGCAPVELREAHAEEMQRDQDEAVRLAYVAATRARDLLVVPVIGDADGTDGGGWLDALNAVVYPASGTRRCPEAAPGCPRFGTDSVLERPESAEPCSGGPVAPGRHRASAGAQHVVWWDPETLGLDREQMMGLRQQRILEADEEEVASAAGEEAHRRWQQLRAERLERGAAASIRVRTVSDLAAEPGAAAESEVEIVDVPLDRSGRPRGARFGTLVHATLAAVDLSADEASVSAVATLQARSLGASEEELAAAVAAVRAALAHPLLRRAAPCDPGSLRREARLAFTREDGSMAEGVADLAFREGSEWTVVDFKTDHDLDGREEVYRCQISLYAEGIRRACGGTVRAVLMRV